MAKELSAYQEHELVKRYQRQNDYQALEELVVAHMPWVKVRAHRMYRQFKKTVEIDDLVQQGVLGLIKGINRYDIRRDEKLRVLTYANWWITAEMQEYAYKNWPVHVPFHILRGVFSERYRKKKDTSKYLLAITNQTVKNLDYVVAQERTASKAKRRIQLQSENPTFDEVDRTYLSPKVQKIFELTGPQKTKALMMYYGILDGFKYEYATIAGEFNITIKEAQVFVKNAKKSYCYHWNKNYLKLSEYDER